MSKKTNGLAAAILCAMALHTSPETRAGFIDIMRGEPVQISYQRVAFVGSARVKEVQGQAEKLVGVDRWAPLKSGAKLQPGDIIRTQQGQVVLRMQSGSFIKVTPNTQLRLTPFEQGWDRAALTGQEEQQGFAVRGCRGDAQFLDTRGQWQKIAVNTVVPEGTQIRVEAGTVLDLYWTTERRPVRLEGQREMVLNASVFQPKPAEALAAVAR